jgi:DNA repair protein RadC
MALRLYRREALPRRWSTHGKYGERHSTFAPLLLCLFHNHPSGDPAPSQEDQEITRRLKETGDVLGIRVLDHVVLGVDRFFSFSDRGLS